MAYKDELNGFQRPPLPEVSGWRSAEPASSVLAAQLAPRLSSQGDQDQTHHLTRETFAQLRQELTAGIYSQLHLDDSVTDVSKLICIVLKAGLGPTSSIYDKSSNETPEEQTLDCLDIIQIAVEKAPQALIELSDPGLLGVNIHAPLFVWLVLQSIDLLRDWDNEGVRAKATILLSSIAYSQVKLVRLWPSCQTVSAFLRACTTGLSRFSIHVDEFQLTGSQTSCCP